MLHKIIIVCSAFLLLWACTARQHSDAHKTTETKAGYCSFKPSIVYAEGFTIAVDSAYKRVVVFDPWQGDTLASYILYPKATSLPANTPVSDFYIPVPINEIASLSSTHIGFIALLDELEKVIGVSNGNKIYNSYLNKKFKNGELIELGRNMGSNLEHILALSPELLMKIGRDNVHDEDVRIIDAGIPVAYNIEWMESSLLGRAEWLKFVATFFNKDALADSIFRKIEHTYYSVTQLANNVTNRLTVLLGNDHKGTWYMPGGKSYVARLITDAGGDYYYRNESSKGSIPLSFEIVLDAMMDADIWIAPHAQSLQELQMMDQRYALFKAFKRGNVFSINGRVNEYGGNDYWETGVARPDIILKDLISMMHPELVPEHTLFYYKKLKKEI